jgi:hypothetical protein
MKRRRTKAEMEKARLEAAGVCDACAGGFKVPKKYHGLDCPVRLTKRKAGKAA